LNKNSLELISIKQNSLADFLIKQHTAELGHKNRQAKLYCLIILWGGCFDFSAAVIKISGRTEIVLPKI